MDRSSYDNQRKHDKDEIEKLTAKLILVNKNDESSVVTLKEEVELMKTRWETSERNMSVPELVRRCRSYGTRRNSSSKQTRTKTTRESALTFR